jgi:hypothetical protein
MYLAGANFAYRKRISYKAGVYLSNSLAVEANSWQCFQCAFFGWRRASGAAVK